MVALKSSLGRSLAALNLQVQDKENEMEEVKGVVVEVVEEIEIGRFRNRDDSRSSHVSKKDDDRQRKGK